jgi:predicted AAA+ superfamily ATPase
MGLILRGVARRFPVVTLTGPRQSGKTKLTREAFLRHAYVSLETPDDRAFASGDPRGFLERYPKSVILDEVQRVPALFSYIQTIVDSEDRPGRYILTGSHNFLLMEHLSQSLAGRAAVLTLLPFSMAELEDRPLLSSDTIGLGMRSPRPPRAPLWTRLFAGFYPRIHDEKLHPTEWLASYYRTYVERDVRNILGVGDLETFSRFIRLCAARTGQILNTASLASDTGITHPTVQKWLSVLEGSYLILLLRPHYANYGKRLIKSPKIYFLDTGLLCYLLGIRRPADLEIHSLRGPIFESFVVSELHKNYLHRGESPRLHYWRSSDGHEVDVLIERGEKLVPIEIKSGQTLAGDSFDGLHYWLKLAGKNAGPAALVYGGKECYRRDGVTVYPWFAL